MSAAKRDPAKRVRLLLGWCSATALASVLMPGCNALTAAPAQAEGQPGPAAAPVAPTGGARIWMSGIGSEFRQGTQQTGFALGGGIGTRRFGSKLRHDLRLAIARFGWVYGSVGTQRDWYHGHPELLGELFAGEQFNPSGRYLFGFTPLIQYNFATGSRWMPFVTGGVGLSYTNISGRDLSNGFQFNVQTGAGTHYFIREDTAVTVQYRWLHLSNAGLERPNSGTNTQMFYAGLDWFH